MNCIGKRYELLSQLGAGGMGVVYRARDRLMRSDVALKRVALHRLAGSTIGVGDTTSQSSATPAMRALRTALAQEFRTLASLRHPNIISVLDYGFDDERTPYFTMELLDSPQDLISACAQLDRDARIDLIVQLLRALTYLHRRGITHRDLKPSNVLIVNTPQGRVLKVVDFGIAAQRGTARDLAGTLQYMAPEVLAGQQPTAGSDLYAVGVMLFQMLTGYFPYSRARITQQAALTVGSEEQQQEQELTLASSVVAFLYANSTDQDGVEFEETRDDRVSFALLGSVMPEPGMTELVTRLLSFDPTARYRDAADVWHDLAAVTGNPITLDTSATRESFLSASVLVGRERELSLLESALSRARGGEGGMLLLGGESGSGKSRLLDELRSSALVRGVRVLRGQAVSSGGSAYQIFLDVLRALTLDTPLEDREAEVLKELLPELPELLDRSIGEAPSVNPQAAQQRLRRVLSALLLRGDGPTLLLLEDLHWAAPESFDLLRELTPAAAHRPLLIVASYRADERPDLPTHFPRAHLIPLQRLRAEEIAALSASMLGEAGTQPDLVAFLERETEGNAFFIVEVVRTLAEEAGGLEQVGKRTLPRHVFSGGVQAVVRRRLQRVPEWARPLLKLAAVAGRGIDRKVLGAVESELARWLECCGDAAILEVSDAEWRFAHDKLREGLLDELRAEERCALHKQVGQLIERVYGEEGAHAIKLAYHFEEAREMARAAHYLSLAGGQALRRGAIKEATELLKRALPLQELLGAPLLERTATLRRLARAQYGLGQVEECLKATKDAMTLLGRPLPATRPGRLWAIARETAIELHNRCFAPRPVRDPIEQAVAREFLSLMRSTGETLFVTKVGADEVLYIMLCALHAAEGIADRVEQVNYLGYFGFIAYGLPLHRLGHYYLEQARKQLHLAPPRLSLGTFYAMASYVYFAEADWPKMIDAHARWLDTVVKGGDDPQQGLVRITRAAAFLTMGRLEDANTDATRAVQIGAQIGNESLRSYGLFWQALVARTRGDLPRTRLILDEVAELVAQKSPRFMDRMMIDSTRAHLAAMRGDLEPARTLADSALSRLRRAIAPTPQFLEGYYATTEASLLIYMKAQTAAEKRAAWPRLRQALWQIVRFSVRFPICRPRALLGIGRALWLRAQKLPAQACLSACLRQARRLRLPYEEALALLWLGRIELYGATPGSYAAQSAAAKLCEAAQQFQALGAPLERDEAEQALAACQPGSFAKAPC